MCGGEEIQESIYGGGKILVKVLEGRWHHTSNNHFYFVEYSVIRGIFLGHKELCSLIS